MSSIEYIYLHIFVQKERRKCYLVLVTAASLGLHHSTVEFLFYEIRLFEMTMSSIKEEDIHRIQTHSSARGGVKGIRNIRSGGLSLFSLCAGTNRI